MTVIVIGTMLILNVVRTISLFAIAAQLLLGHTPASFNLAKLCSLQAQIIDLLMTDSTRSFVAFQG